MTDEKQGQIGPNTHVQLGPALTAAAAVLALTWSLAMAFSRIERAEAKQGALEAAQAEQANTVKKIDKRTIRIECATRILLKQPCLPEGKD